MLYCLQVPHVADAAVTKYSNYSVKKNNILLVVNVFVLTVRGVIYWSRSTYHGAVK